MRLGGLPQTLPPDRVLAFCSDGDDVIITYHVAYLKARLILSGPDCGFGKYYSFFFSQLEGWPKRNLSNCRDFDSHHLLEWKSFVQGNRNLKLFGLYFCTFCHRLVWLREERDLVHKHTKVGDPEVTHWPRLPTAVPQLGGNDGIASLRYIVFHGAQHLYFKAKKKKAKSRFLRQ